MQILALAGKELLHQRVPQTLRGAALDLSLNESRINGAANIVRGVIFSTRTVPSSISTSISARCAPKPKTA